MSEQMARFTTISVTPEVRDDLRDLKRGGESYSDLLRKVMAGYDPDSVTE